MEATEFNRGAIKLKRLNGAGNQVGNRPERGNKRIARSPERTAGDDLGGREKKGEKKQRHGPRPGYLPGPPPFFILDRLFSAGHHFDEQVP